MEAAALEAITRARRTVLTHVHKRAGRTLKRLLQARPLAWACAAIPGCLLLLLSGSRLDVLLRGLWSHAATQQAVALQQLPAAHWPGAGRAAAHALLGGGRHLYVHERPLSPSWDPGSLISNASCVSALCGHFRSGHAFAHATFLPVCCLCRACLLLMRRLPCWMRWAAPPLLPHSQACSQLPSMPLPQCRCQISGGPRRCSRCSSSMTRCAHERTCSAWHRTGQSRKERFLGPAHGLLVAARPDL